MGFYILLISFCAVLLCIYCSSQNRKWRKRSEMILDQLRVHFVNQKSLSLIHLREWFWLTTNHAIWQMNYLLEKIWCSWNWEPHQTKSVCYLTQLWAWWGCVSRPGLSDTEPPASVLYLMAAGVQVSALCCNEGVRSNFAYVVRCCWWDVCAETETIEEGGTRITTVCRNCKESIQLKLKACFFSAFQLTVV